MSRECLGCGRRLRTGRKWCYECKHNPNKGKNNFSIVTRIMVGIAMMVGVWVLFGPNEMSLTYNPLMFWILEGFIVYLWTFFEMNKFIHKNTESKNFIHLQEVLIYVFSFSLVPLVFGKWLYLTIMLSVAYVGTVIIFILTLKE